MMRGDRKAAAAAMRRGLFARLKVIRALKEVRLERSAGEVRMGLGGTTHSHGLAILGAQAHRGRLEVVSPAIKRGRTYSRARVWLSASRLKASHPRGGSARLEFGDLASRGFGLRITPRGTTLI